MRRINGQWCVIQDNQHGESGDRIIQRINNLERWANGASGTARDVSEAVPYKKPEFGPVKASPKGSCDNSKAFNRRRSHDTLLRPSATVRQLHMQKRYGRIAAPSNSDSGTQGLVQVQQALVDAVSDGNLPATG